MKKENNLQHPQKEEESRRISNEQLSLANVTNRKELLNFAKLKGYEVQGSRIPLDFYKKEINLVDFARAIGYEYSEKTTNVSQAAFARQRWFYMEKKQMKFPELERDENASSQILISRRSEGPNSPNFKYNEHYYFSQQLAHTGDKKNHGSIVDLVQLHFKADFKDSIKIIENFIYKNNELKENALPFHLSGTAVGQASEVKRLESYYNIRPLSDTSYLNSRGISDETLKSTTFRGRIHNALSDDKKHLNTAFPISSENGLIGFEVRNTDFKSVLDHKNDGFWRSNVDHEKPVKEIFVTESAIDALSQWELKQLQSQQPRTDVQDVYLSTAGSITGRQIDLLQKMLDKGMSRKAMLLSQVPQDAIKDIAQVTSQKDERGQAVLDSNGQVVQVAHVHYNKPEKLTLGFDNDTAGAMLTVKVLGRLQASEFFKVPDKNSALNSSQIDPYRNNKTNIGRLSWSVSPTEKSDGQRETQMIVDYFKEKNIQFKDKLSEGEPFNISKIPSKEGKPLQVEIEFKNISKTWNLAVEAIHKLKFQDSKKLEIARPVLKDWNEDLKAVKGIDEMLKKRYNIYNSVNQFNNIGKQAPKQQVKNQDPLMEEISKAMDRSKRIKL